MAIETAAFPDKLLVNAPDEGRIRQDLCLTARQAAGDPAASRGPPAGRAHAALAAGHALSSAT